MLRSLGRARLSRPNRLTGQSTREEGYPRPLPIATERPRPSSTLGCVLPLGLSNGEVILVVVFVALPIAAIAFAGAGAVYREIGRGAFAMDHDAKPAKGGPGEQVSQQVQEAEVRQMLEAKAFRQAERGEPTIDVDAEMEKLMAPKVDVAADPELVEEVRQLVVARNARRLRSGKEPLDVEAEIARQLSDLENLGQ